MSGLFLRIIWILAARLYPSFPIHVSRKTRHVLVRKNTAPHDVNDLSSDSSRLLVEGATNTDDKTIGRI